jgi:VIT1/CCC1 family predicted Fe2+/Mn2+ transporter
MATTTPLDLIAHSLAPGIALTSVIFFNTSLLNRFAYVTGRVRELTRESRELRRTTRDSPDHARLRSIRAQVDALIVRARMIRRTIMLVYVSLLSFISSILLLLTFALFGITSAADLPIIAFAAGLIIFALAASRGIAEIALSYHTIEEEARNSVNIDAD